MRFSLIVAIGFGALVIGGSAILAPPASSQTNLYTDRFGNTSGTVGDDSVNLYTDRGGYTTGSIGDESVSTYRDRFGYTN
jgi:hypothetical protein